MTTELITGHAGSAHVSAADVGWYNVGVVGEGKYVLDTGTQFACNVQSANLVTIGIGDALFEGRHVRVSATENVALDNGAQGMNRNDLICIKYEYNSSTSVETASLDVIKGTASSGTAVDPDIPSGSILEGATTAYMPLWRIPISGITVGTPAKLYGEVLTALDGALSRTWGVTQIPNLPASKTTSGTFDVARIPNLDASKTTSGTFDAARIPNIPASKITSPTWVPKATVLYNSTNGTTGTVSLSASAANYNHMRIYFRANDGNNQVNSVDVYSPNGKTASLSLVSPDNNGIWVNGAQVAISGTSITRTSNKNAHIGTNQTSTTQVIMIIRVEAWNE